MKEKGHLHPYINMNNINISARNLINANGNPAANQIIISIIGKTDDEKEINLRQFNSYDKKIILIDYIGEESTIALDSKAFNYSVTTSKYLNLFLELNYINPEDIRKIYNIGKNSKLTNKYTTYNIIIMDLNNN